MLHARHADDVVFVERRCVGIDRREGRLRWMRWRDRLTSQGTLHFGVGAA
jgi:hypothetical protein